jgi:hypothetical protein
MKKPKKMKKASAYSKVLSSAPIKGLSSDVKSPKRAINEGKPKSIFAR